MNDPGMPLAPRSRRAHLCRMGPLSRPECAASVGTMVPTYFAMLGNDAERVVSFGGKELAVACREIL